VEDSLDDTGVIAEVYEDQAAVVPSFVDPTGKRHVVADMF
jgi:hypothetical protein